FADHPLRCRRNRSRTIVVHVGNSIFQLRLHVPNGRRHNVSPSCEIPDNLKRKYVSGSLTDDVQIDADPCRAYKSNHFFPANPPMEHDAWIRGTHLAQLFCHSAEAGDMAFTVWN